MLTARAHSLVHQKLWVTISTRRGCLSITQLFCRYVLLKERNMLLTLRHESKRQGVPMPSPTRLHKVRGGQPASRRYPCFWTPNGFNELQEMSFNPSQEVQEAVPISLFSTPNRFNKLQEMRNLTPVSDVYKAVPTSFFWAPNRHNELLELRFEFPFNLIGKLTMAFLLGQYGVIQILVHWLGSRTRILALSSLLQTDLNTGLVPSVVQGRGGMMLSKYRELISAFNTKLSIQYYNLISRVAAYNTIS